MLTPRGRGAARRSVQEYASKFVIEARTGHVRVFGNASDRHVRPFGRGSNSLHKYANSRIHASRPRESGNGLTYVIEHRERRGPGVVPSTRR